MLKGHAGPGFFLTQGIFVVVFLDDLKDHAGQGDEVKHMEANVFCRYSDDLKGHVGH